VTAYQQIVGLLSQLSADELAALEKRIKSLRALSGNAVSQPSSSPDEDTEFFVLSCASELRTWTKSPAPTEREGRLDSPSQALGVDYVLDCVFMDLLDTLHSRDMIMVAIEGG